MTKVDHIKTNIVDLLTIRAHKRAITAMTFQSILLIRVFRSDSIAGVGEATTIAGLAYSEESPDGIKQAVDTYFAPMLIGNNSDRPAGIMARLQGHIVGNRFGKYGIETALLDALGRPDLVPVSELIGGRRRDAAPVALTLANGDTSKDIEEGEAMREARRHRIFKIKIGAAPTDEDCGHVERIARALADRVSISVDVNQRWTRAEVERGGLARRRWHRPDRAAPCRRGYRGDGTAVPLHQGRDHRRSRPHCPVRRNDAGSRYWNDRFSPCLLDCSSPGMGHGIVRSSVIQSGYPVPASYLPRFPVGGPWRARVWD